VEIFTISSSPLFKIFKGTVSSPLFKIFKGTVSVYLSDPPCKENNVRITKVPLKSLFKYELDIKVYIFEN